MMTDEELQVIFRDKLEKNYKSAYDLWMKMSPEELIEEATVIHSTKSMYEYYKRFDCSYNPDGIRYLIGFKNPLEILTDDVLCDAGFNIAELDHSMWEICDRRSADTDYEKDYNYYETPKPGQGMPFGM